MTYAKPSAARVPLPDASDTPGIRPFLRDRADMRFRELVPGWALLEPAEGAGRPRTFFTAHRLCDRNTSLDDSAVWEPIVSDPPYDQPDEVRTSPSGAPTTEWRAKLGQHADMLAIRGVQGSDLAAVSAKLGAIPPDELPAFLKRQLPALFEAFPEGSLWYITTDDVLIARLTVGRAMLALKLTPDVVTPKDFGGVRALEEHSITDGVRFADLYDPLLLIFTPSATGMVFDVMPHMLVFLFGMQASLVQDWPPSMTALYEPKLQSHFGLHWIDSNFFEGVSPVDGEALLQWWTQRLNVVYSHAVDPTCFVDSSGNHRPGLQQGWLLTVERMIADLTLVLAGFQAPPLTRLQSAFDLLDKAESLLGFTQDRTGKGFERLLRRTSMEKRFDEIWERLPVQLRPRFRQHTRWLFSAIYEDVRKRAFANRVTPTGVKVGREDGTLINRTNEMYVSELIREIRNSSHGLLGQLEGPHRLLLATHRGKLPAQIPDLAAMVAFGLIADCEALFEERWLPTP